MPPTVSVYESPDHDPRHPRRSNYYFANGAAGADLEGPDHDGIENLLEYAFGSNHVFSVPAGMESMIFMRLKIGTPK
jgi:hypothetical protein